MTLVNWPQYLALALFGVLIAVIFAYEAICHQRNLEKFKLRIHVNGTRGKSSVTRLIAAGLRAGGYSVVAKTTGSAARVILPDGTEQPIRRRGPANIREIIKVVALACRVKADAIVFECMAVQPELQRVSEWRLMKSHIGVITNVRPDHEDVLGEGLLNVAAALAGTIPAAGSLVTTPEAYQWLRGVNNMDKVNSKTYCVSSDEVSADCIAGFPYEVVPENIAVALKVCELAGVPIETALTGMRLAIPDCGTLTVTKRILANKEVTVINAFAANDPESTLLLWQRYIKTDSNVFVWLNARADRRYRTTQLAKALASVHRGAFLLSGDAVFAKRELLGVGVPKPLIHILPQDGWENVLESIMRRQACETMTLFTAGNVAGVSVFSYENRTGADAVCTSCS